MNGKANRVVRMLAGAFILAVAVFGAVEGASDAWHGAAVVASNDPSPTSTTAF
jgi:hypothetical protein